MIWVFLFGSIGNTHLSDAGASSSPVAFPDRWRDQTPAGSRLQPRALRVLELEQRSSISLALSLPITALNFLQGLLEVIATAGTEAQLLVLHIAEELARSVVFGSHSGGKEFGLLLLIITLGVWLVLEVGWLKPEIFCENALG